jgi:hypothetical protein
MSTPKSPAAAGIVTTTKKPSSIVRSSKVTRADRLTRLSAGVLQFFGSWQKLTLGAKDYAPTEVVDALHAAIAADQVTSADRDKLTADAEIARATFLKVAPLIRYLKMFAILQLSDDPDAAQKLGVFGLTPRKVVKQTAAQKAAAASKRAATRSAKKAALAAAQTAPAPAPAPAATPAPAPTPVK